MIDTKASRQYTELGLRTFYKHTTLGNSDLFLLIDNDASLDQSSILDYPQLQRVKNERPGGFAFNMNLGISAAIQRQADVFLLNNDVVFPQDWIEPLLIDNGAIISPLSNREVQYASNFVVVRTQFTAQTFMTGMLMDMNDYQGNEAIVEAISQVHRKGNRGYWSVYVLPFYCTKIPYNVLVELGKLDETFGRGGGEDFDYCLRAVLAGFKVQFALSSLIIHFGGKSSHSGVESKPEQLDREEKFKQVFKSKWGEKLFSLILEERTDYIANDQALKAADQQGNLLTVVRGLMGDRQVSIKI